MKKLFALLALLGTVSVAGCACQKEGVYKFDSIVLKVGDEEKTYTCTTEEKEGSMMVAGICEMAEAMHMELKDDKATIKYIVDGEEIEDAEVNDYKIEEGKFSVKEEDEEEYEEIGTYEKGKITLEMTKDIKIILAKE